MVRFCKNEGPKVGYGKLRKENLAAKPEDCGRQYGKVQRCFLRRLCGCCLSSPTILRSKP